MYVLCLLHSFRSHQSLLGSPLTFSNNQLSKFLNARKSADLQPPPLVASRESVPTQRNSRAEIITRLRGQEINVPDIYYIYEGWETKVHPGVQTLRDHLEGYFAAYIGTASQIKKQRRVDNGLVVGHFWSHVEVDKFLVLGELTAWVSSLSHSSFEYQT